MSIEQSLCPRCGKASGISIPENTSFRICSECGWDEAEEMRPKPVPLAVAKAEAAQATLGPMGEVISKLLDDVAEAIEEQLSTKAPILAAGGPYMQSLMIAQDKKLQAAAAAALTIIVNNPSLKPPQN